MTLALVAKRLETFRAAALREATLDRFVVSSYCSKESRCDRSESAAPADGAQTRPEEHGDSELLKLLRF